MKNYMITGYIMAAILAAGCCNGPVIKNGDSPKDSVAVTAGHENMVIRVASPIASSETLTYKATIMDIGSVDLKAMNLPEPVLLGGGITSSGNGMVVTNIRLYPGLESQQVATVIEKVKADSAGLVNKAPDVNLAGKQPVSIYLAKDSFRPGDNTTSAKKQDNIVVQLSAKKLPDNMLSLNSVLEITTVQGEGVGKAEMNSTTNVTSQKSLLLVIDGDGVPANIIKGKLAIMLSPVE